jgi:ATP-dependent helicase/nuclease subunit A
VPAAVAATTIARIDKSEAEADADRAPFRWGRGGSAVGRAVHSVLQGIDLADPRDLVARCRAQAVAEGIPERQDEVADLVRRGLASPVVQRAVAVGRYYREVFVGVPLGRGYLEGFVDLVLDTPTGIVIADYKTDVVDRDAEADQTYLLQAGVYALAVTRATGRPVVEVVLVYLRSGRERRVTDLAAVTARARDEAEAALSRPVASEATRSG